MTKDEIQNAMQAIPAYIPVTDEMIADGEAVCPVVAHWKMVETYRAMAAKAPTYDPHLPSTAAILAENERIVGEMKRVMAWNDELVKSQYELTKRLRERDSSFHRAKNRNP